MADLTIRDVLDVDYPDAPSWNADGSFLAVPVHGDVGQSLRIVPMDAPSDSWEVPLGEGMFGTHAWAPATDPALLAVATTEGELRLVDVAAETVEVLTGHADSDDLAWSDDGGSLAFYRDGSPTVFDLDAGTDRRFDVPDRGTFLGEAEMLAWSPDGTRLAHRFVEFDTKQVGVLDVDTGETVWRSRDPAYATSTPQWIEGDRLLIDRLGEAGTVREIVAVDVTDGSEQVLYREENREHGTVSRGAPVVSPDADRIALTLPEDGWEHVYLLDPETGERTQLTSGEFADKGLAASRPRWRSSAELVFASNREDPGRRGIYRVTLDGDTRMFVPPEGNSVHPRPSPDGDRLAYVYADRETSAELRVLTHETDETVRVTRSAVTDWDVDPIAPERVSFESVGGMDIEAYLLDPRDSEVVESAEEYPAVVWVHGGPMRQMRDGWHPGPAYGLMYTYQQYLAHQGYVGLLVNYRGGIGYGTDFRTALAGHRGEDEMEDIVAGAEYLRDLDYVDSDAIGMWGISYGGYAALQLLGTHPDAFDVAVNLAGLADLELYRDWAEATKYPSTSSSIAVRRGGEPWEVPEAWAEASPVTHFEHYENPLYSFHGTADRYVNFEQLDLAVEELLDYDADHEWEYYPDENHLFAERATWRRAFAKIEAAFDEHLR